MVALPALVSGLDAEMVRLGYKDSTMVWYRGCWRRLQRYFAARGVEEFSLDLAMAWVDEACGFFAKEQAGTLKQTDVYLFRVAQMLGDYEAHGAVLRRYSRTVSKLTGDEAAAVARFEAWLRAAERSASTVRSYGTLAGEFAAFAGTRGGLARCDAGTVGAFTATLAGYQAKTVEQKLCALRSFLRFASEDGPGRLRGGGGGPGGAVPQAGQDPVGLGPGRRGQDPGSGRPGQPVREARLRDHLAGGPARAAQHRRQAAGVLRFRLAGLPAVRRPGQDRPQGAAAAAERRRLGGHRLRPRGRPASDCPQVFLRHTAPVGPFSDQDHLHQILVKHARAAHVPVSEERRHGMHSLRHTLATRLMEDGTPVEQIADILGHQSVPSTGVYLKSSLGLLSRCALDPDAPAGQVSR